MLRVALVIVGLVTLIGAPGASVYAAAPTRVVLEQAGAAEVNAVFVRPPASMPEGQPLQAVISLHGMGGNGADFASGLIEQADRYGWLLVAPTISYGDWTDPQQIAHEDPALAAWLSDEIAHLGERTGYDVRPQVLLFGHSRGAQLSLRFAEMHPEQVAGVAAASAGTYTLPEVRDAQTGQALTFPFGVADLARDDGGQPFDAQQFLDVPIWIGVGADDDNPGDVPHAWDPYIGDDRVQRAEEFSAALSDLGADVKLEEFPGTSHGLTDEMRVAGCNALAQAEVQAEEQG